MLYTDELEGHAVEDPVIAAGCAVELEIVIQRYADAVPQVSLARTQSVPLVKPEPKVTDPVVPVPLTVASPVIVHS